MPGAGGGPVPTAPGSQRGTVLYDAVYLSAHDMLAKEVGRKAMILLTDGEDEGSQLKIQDAIEAAQKADAIVYVLLCADRGFYGSFQVGYSGESEMRKLTEATGGRVINVGNKFDKLREAFDQIAAELRSQYNLGYTPTNTSARRHLPQTGNQVQTELQNPMPRRLLRDAAPTPPAIMLVWSNDYVERALLPAALALVLLRESPTLSERSEEPLTRRQLPLAAQGVSINAPHFLLFTCAHYRSQRKTFSLYTAG